MGHDASSRPVRDAARAAMARHTTNPMAKALARSSRSPRAAAMVPITPAATISVAIRVFSSARSV